MTLNQSDFTKHTGKKRKKKRLNFCLCDKVTFSVTQRLFKILWGSLLCNEKTLDAHTFIWLDGLSWPKSRPFGQSQGQWYEKSLKSLSGPHLCNRRAITSWCFAQSQLRNKWYVLMMNQGHLSKFTWKRVENAAFVICTMGYIVPLGQV